MVRSRPDHPAMWSFPHLLATNSPRKKMERKKTPSNFHNCSDWKTVSETFLHQQRCNNLSSTTRRSMPSSKDTSTIWLPWALLSPFPQHPVPPPQWPLQPPNDATVRLVSHHSSLRPTPKCLTNAEESPKKTPISFTKKCQNTEDCPMRIPPYFINRSYSGQYPKKKCLEWENWLELWMLRGFCSRRNCILKTKMETEVILCNETMKNNKKRQQRQFSITQLAIFSFIFRGPRCSAGGWLPCSHRSKACQNHGGIPCNAARASAGLRGTQSGVACLAHEVLRTLQQLKA